MTALFSRRVLWIIPAALASASAVPYVDCNGLIAESAALSGAQPGLRGDSEKLTVKHLLALPVNFASLITINGRLVHEAKSKTFLAFVAEAKKEIPRARAQNAMMLANAILIYCEQTMVHGPLQYSPKFYQDFYYVAAKARANLSKADQLNDVMVFLDAESFGTGVGVQIMWEKSRELAKRSRPTTRVNLAKRAVVGHVATRKFLKEIQKTGSDTYSRVLIDDLISLASESRVHAPSIAVLRCLVHAVNGEKEAAKKLANQYRTNESLNIHCREGLLEMAKTGDWQKLRKAMDQPFIVGWKKGD